MENKQVNVRTAVKTKYHKYLNHTVDTTAGAFQVLPMYYREIQPYGSVKCKDPFFLAYALPMSVPSLAKYEFHFNKFFIPYKYVWPAWEDFFLKNLHYYPSNSNGTPVAPAIPAKKPFITHRHLCELFLSSSELVTDVTGTSTNPVDIIFWTGTSGDPIRSYTLTRKGIVALKLLQHLGYELTWRGDDQREFEILTLLCYGKTFMEYYYPRNYAFTSANFYSIYNATITDSPVVEAGPGGSHNATYYQALYGILHFCTYTYFNNSEYYDAWDKPMAPNSTNTPPFDMVDPTNNATNGVNAQKITTAFRSSDSPSSSTYAPSNNTPFVAGEASGLSNAASGVITNWVIKALGRVTDFVKRYQLVGNDRIERWMAYLGVKLPDSHKAVHLGEDFSLLRVSSIQATADSVNSEESVNSVVGERGGAAEVRSSDFKIDFENREFSHGLYLILMHISLDNYMVTGIDRQRLNVSALECLQPQFDAFGPASVTAAELQNSENAVYNDAPNSHFGFLPQKYEYALDRHIQSGAFRASTFGAAELKAWFPRRYQADPYQSNIVHSLDFMHPQTVDLDAANLPFYNLKYSENFIVSFELHGIDLYDFKKPLKMQYEFEDSEGDYIELENQGSIISGNN